ncbi:hypothetical protein [Nostoc sp.]
MTNDYFTNLRLGLMTQIFLSVAAILGGLSGSIHFWKKHRAIGNRGYTD